MPTESSPSTSSLTDTDQTGIKTSTENNTVLNHQRIANRVTEEPKMSLI